ncbi:PAS domain S-box protein [Altererythrobacter soli]|uniref:histidine kinase n=1 Tax=Croceibacterium soli TaxID=1739690 RepID=A0A6I4UTV0_9SPHN|nr:ATP-binding protein [Croceibacterium soli]MXP42078.1 PAS domain S-box protein [Croceibacterium soli]
MSTLAQTQPQSAGTDARWRRTVWLAILCAPIIIAAIALLVYQQTASADRLRAAVSASQERRALVLSVLSAHQDLETGQRGYLITGREDFLDPYHASMADLEAILSRMKHAFASQPEQLRLLALAEQASREKRKFSEGTVALHRAGDAVAARELVLSGRGKYLMDGLRGALGAMLEAEERHLGRISRQATDATTALRWLTLGLLGGLLFLLTAAAIALGRMLEQRQRMLATLEDTSQRRAAILNSAMDAILILNPSGTIESVNPAAVRMYGYDEDELLSRDAGMLFAEPPPIGRVAQLLRELNLMESEPGSLREIVGRRKSGETFPTDVAITRAPFAEGLRYVVVIRDITERKRIETMKAEFVSTVSHELRTPLTSIAGSLGLLAGGAAGELSDKVKRLITIAHSNADRLVRLINDILDVEKLESGKMSFDNRPIDLTSALQQALDENAGFARSYNVDLRFDRPEVAAHVLADSDRLAQVIANLLSNAIKFSPAGGCVSLTLAPGRRRHRITVSDQGPGIPEEFHTRIFEKFVQADSSDARAKGGTGLGLSIVREIVEQLGGSISFDSRPSEGTQFHVHLPALVEEETVERVRHSVLLCGPSTASPLLAALDATHDVHTAQTLPTAYQMLDSGPFDAVLVEFGSHAGDVAQIVRYVRRSTCNETTPILAFGEDAEGQLVTDPALVVDWLHKPLEVDTIGQRIDQTIQGDNGARPVILHVDDDPDILRVVAAAMSDKAQVVSAKSLAQARSAIDQERFDAVILDLTLSDGRGPELLAHLREKQGSVPIVVFSAEDADGANAGQFEDFLTKAKTPLRRLVDVVERHTKRQGAHE